MVMMNTLTVMVIIIMLITQDYHVRIAPINGHVHHESSTVFSAEEYYLKPVEGKYFFEYYLDSTLLNIFDMITAIS